MNNKGQTLVAFVIILPVILLILLALIDFGLVSIRKHEISTTIKDAITLYFNNNQDDIELEIKKLINKNIDVYDIEDLSIVHDNEYVKIDIEVKYNSIFNFLNINKKIKVSYIGKKVNNEIRIEEG